MTRDICGTLTDKMPSVLHGTEGWTGEERAHLDGCADCAGEWKLLQAAARLGHEAASGLDTARLGNAVLDEVKRRGRRDRWRRSGGMLGLAAAAVIALVVLTRGPSPRPVLAGVDSAVMPAAQMGANLPLAELESLDSTQLESVLEGLDAPVGEVAPGPSPSFGDLDDSQLERVLRSLEG